MNEINLPAVQAGSSIMPGKVNPVIPEVVNQVAFEVIGNDVTVTLAAEGGQLQLNAFEPIIAHSLFKSLRTCAKAASRSRATASHGITANPRATAATVRNSIGIVTALNPYIGYENAARSRKQAHASGGSVYDLVLESGLMTREQLDEVMKPENLDPTATDAAPSRRVGARSTRRSGNGKIAGS